MKVEDVKVGMKVWYKNHDNQIENGVVTRFHDICNETVWVEWEEEDQEYWIEVSAIEPVEDNFPLTNTKINVQKYADDNGLTLAAAHKEVQEWLFGQGYGWCHYGKAVSFDKGDWIEVGLDALSNTITWCYDGEEAMGDCKEITLQRAVAVTLTPSFVEPVAEAVEYVELGGNTYEKAWVETVVGAVLEAQRKLKSMEEGK